MTTNTIHELLTNPEYLLSLSDAELKNLLAPYIPSARTPVLPQESATKKFGVEYQALKEALNHPEIMKGLAALRAKN